MDMSGNRLAIMELVCSFYILNIFKQKPDLNKLLQHLFTRSGSLNNAFKQSSVSDFKWAEVSKKCIDRSSVSDISERERLLWSESRGELFWPALRVNPISLSYPSPSSYP